MVMMNFLLTMDGANMTADLFGFMTYTTVALGCLVSGALFHWWTKHTDDISTIWVYEIILFYSIALSKSLSAVCKGLRLWGNNNGHTSYHNFLESTIWNIRDIPFSIAVGLFIFMMAKRLNKRRKLLKKIKNA